MVCSTWSKPTAVSCLRLPHRPGAETEVSAHIHMSDQTPIGSITTAALRRIVALNADFDLDLYVVDDAYLQGNAASR